MAFVIDDAFLPATFCAEHPDSIQGEGLVADFVLTSLLFGIRWAVKFF